VMIKRQRRGRPVHTWRLSSLREAEGWKGSFRTVSQIMETDLFTVRPEDVADLAATLMEWERLRHLPVEDDEGNLVGLVTTAELLKLVSRRFDRDPMTTATVESVMIRNVVTCTPETPTLAAVELLREHGIGCLPVVKGDRLVGIVTDKQFVDVAARLLQEKSS
ncbi:MAG: CBS domain-containing protein, partial [Myxococcales bacterium]|nr:CBS domain-containing protein [Myxococcales bacterium]